jgi:hypothetical protein
MVPLARWSSPEQHLFRLGVKSPYRQPTVGGTHDSAQALCLCVQPGLSQHTTHKDGHFLWGHLKTDKTILLVANLPAIKTTIPREESPRQWRRRCGRR